MSEEVGLRRVRRARRRHQCRQPRPTVHPPHAGQPAELLLPVQAGEQHPRVQGADEEGRGGEGYLHPQAERAGPLGGEGPHRGNLHLLQTEPHLPQRRGTEGADRRHDGLLDHHPVVDQVSVPGAGVPGFGHPKQHHVRCRVLPPRRRREVTLRPRPERVQEPHPAGNRTPGGSWLAGRIHLGHRIPRRRRPGPQQAAGLQVPDIGQPDIPGPRVGRAVATSNSAYCLQQRSGCRPRVREGQPA